MATSTFHIIAAKRDDKKTYLLSWGKFWFFVDLPEHAHRFKTYAEADSIFGLLLREKFPGYEHKIIPAPEVAPAPKTGMLGNLFK